MSVKGPLTSLLPSCLLTTLHNPHQYLCQSLNSPNALLPHGLCTCCCMFLGHSSLHYLQALLPQFLLKAASDMLYKEEQLTIPRTLFLYPVYYFQQCLSPDVQKGGYLTRYHLQWNNDTDGALFITRLRFQVHSVPLSTRMEAPGGQVLHLHYSQLHDKILEVSDAWKIFSK